MKIIIPFKGSCSGAQKCKSAFKKRNMFLWCKSMLIWCYWAAAQCRTIYLEWFNSVPLVGNRRILQYLYNPQSYVLKCILTCFNVHVPCTTCVVKCCTEKLQPKADLQRLCHCGDCLGLLLMHAWGSFLTLLAHVQTSALFDDLDRDVSGWCFAWHSRAKYWSPMAVYRRAIWGWMNARPKLCPSLWTRWVRDPP